MGCGGNTDIRERNSSGDKENAVFANTAPRKAAAIPGSPDFEVIRCSDNSHLFENDLRQAEAVDKAKNSGCGRIGSREFIFDLPPHYDPNHSPAYPVFYVWHGCESSGGGFRNAVNITASSIEPVISIYPDSDGDNNCWSVRGESTRDFKFFDSLHRAITRSFNVDENRVFSLGFSAGAYMTHYLGCTRNSIIQGLAAVAGAIPEAAQPCQSPMPALIAHGREDTAVEYLPNFDNTLEHYSQVNRCQNSASVFKSRAPSNLADEGVTFTCQTQACETTLRYCVAACSEGPGNCLRERSNHPPANMAAHDLSTWIWFIKWSVGDLLNSS